MSELRLYLRRDSLQEGTDCSWALLDDNGRLQGSGARLENLPASCHCRLVLAGDLVLTVKVPLPDLPERRLAPLLPAAAEAATLAEADSIHVVVMDRGTGGEATLAVVEDAWLGSVLSKLTGLGLDPNSALPEYLLLPWTEGCWSIGWRAGDVIARFGKAQGSCLDAGEPPVGLSLALAQHGHPKELKVYQGEHVGEPDWPRWRAALATTVAAAGPWDWRTAAWPELRNLLQGKHSLARHRMDWTRLARPLAWGAISLVGIQVLGMTMDWAMLAREKAAISREMKDLAERALPAHAAIVDPPWQVSERLRGLHAATGNPTSHALIGLLGRLSQVWPAATATRVQSLSYEAGALTVSIDGAEATWLDQLKATAAARGLFINAQDDKDKGKGIRLTVKPSAEEDRHGR